MVWRHMIIARNPSVLIDGVKDCVMLHAANILSRMNPPLSPNYLGNVSIGGATERLKVLSLLGDSGLATVSTAIHKSAMALNSPDRVALTIGLLNLWADPSDFKFAYNGFLGPDVSTTS